MHVQFVSGVLLLCGHAALASSPDSSSVGTVQVLNYNNLRPENSGGAALLIHDHLNHKNALRRCAAVGETLLPISTVRSNCKVTDIQFELDYLVATGGLTKGDSLWVQSSEDDECMAYSYRSRRVSKVSCDTKLPSLCSSKVAPTTDKNTSPMKDSKVTVTSSDYKITGYRDKRSFRFLGIPFADAPVQKLRFMPPQNYTGTRSIDATKVSAPCIQPVSPFGDSTNISEDCLYLNVFTPVLPAKVSRSSARRPVAVYFYGGAFVVGANSLIDYDGGNFASRNDVVIVTVNYRIGALGFLASESMLDGSLGIKDQIQALRWVRDHVAAFGGDPEQVTIFGQSAGGQSSIALLSSSSAKGLFHGAIVQSAPVDLPWFTRDVYSKMITPIVATAVGCNDTKTEKDLVSCLQSVPATSFIASNKNYATALSGIAQVVAKNYFHSGLFQAQTEPILPMVDDKGTGVIDDQFDKLLKNGKVPSRVPVMFTTVKDEGTMYVNRVLTSSIGNTQALLDSTFGIAFPSDLASSMIASGAFKTDPKDPDSVRNMVSKAVTEAQWTCPQAYLLDNGGLYAFSSLYEVEIGQGHQQSSTNTTSVCFPNDNYNATCHSADVLPVWGNLNSKTKGVQPYFGEDDILHSQLLNDIWGAFIRTGDPNPDTKMLKIRGPAYTSTLEIFGHDEYRISQYKKNAKQIALLSMPPSVTDNPGQSKQCAVFEKHGFTFQNAKVETG
ncbi:cholinesterase [Pochonia chlamydosporia 170]|uniref:Cholinesterase n=1 Tax=Pochonia chlamydosporia 170 TaxID=1380566 RepID=A0A179FRQ6_METCM|nr:cholinesterase [Pochonia chlamydosporia 170]OAQ67773.1 cholinesterase [Pochonia chlamydosporia 170]